MKTITEGMDLNLLRGLLRKYGDDKLGMYIEYPHKSRWSSGFSGRDYRTALKNLFSSNKDAPLLLYVHIPFCPRQCYFCSCSSVVTRDYERIKRYLQCLYREIDMFREFFESNSITPNFKEIHIGGGSPTCLKEKEFDELVAKLNSLGAIKKAKEFATEVDPRFTKKENLEYYYSKGINRISIGVQDFNTDVQKAVNRVQPLELIEALLEPDVRKKFTSINFDILCGLPRQTRESFNDTIETVIKLSPDRTCLLYLDYAPEVKKHQRFMKESEIPDFYAKSVFFHDALRRLTESGYVRVGFEHFAKSTDELAKAAEMKTLHWNALGYRAGKFLDIIGLGSSSASRITERYYSQNFYAPDEYEAAIMKGDLAIYRSHKLNNDEIIRRDIIYRLRTYFSLDFTDIEKEYSINFKTYFSNEEAMLKALAKDGLLELSENKMGITEVGRYLTHVVCRVFDRFATIKKG